MLFIIIENEEFPTVTF